MADNKTKKKTSIGGQALIEGVMMRGPQLTALAVRHTSGEIRTDSWETAGKSRPKVLKIPFVRGVINFVESMISGYKCMMKSMEMSGIEDEIIAESKKETVENADEDEVLENAPEKAETAPKKEGKGLMTLIMIVASVLGVALSMVLFMFLPIQLRKWLSIPLPFLENSVWRAVFEGLIRIVIFLAYMVGVSFMKDIKRVFMYHGAEHKTIFCHENGDELTVENVRKQSRFHPRCGTSFMFLMLFIGIIVSIFIRFDDVFLRTAFKLITLPIVVSLGYELIKLAGRSDNILVRIISTPGLWVQRITTKEPTDDMIEVAIESFQMVVPENQGDDAL